MKLTGYLAILSLSLLSQSVFAANDTISYKNTRGSTLTLQFATDNTPGEFITAVASKECQQAIGMKRPIVGYTAKIQSPLVLTIQSVVLWLHSLVILKRMAS